MKIKKEIYIFFLGGGGGAGWGRGQDQDGCERRIGRGFRVDVNREVKFL